MKKVAVLARQFRFPTVAQGPGWVLELVAGTVEIDESPEQCIRREIVEEYGYETLTLRRLCTFYTSTGGSSERIHLFEAVIGAATRTGDAGGNGAEQEDIELVEIPLNEVSGLLASGKVVDAKTIIGLSWLVQEHCYRIRKRPQRQIHVITGDIREWPGIDVWVNSENTNMQMARFYDRSLSAMIRYEGAEKDDNGEAIDDTIARELAAAVGGRESVTPGTVYVTGAGALAATRGVKKIFHAATTQGVPGSGYQVMRDVEKCR
ncbi:MAG: NUDIX domain-containing protein [Pseudonocardiaceae bacterium]